MAAVRVAILWQGVIFFTARRGGNIPYTGQRVDWNSAVPKIACTVRGNMYDKSTYIHKCQQNE